MVDLSKIRFHKDGYKVQLENPSLEDIDVYIDFNIARDGYMREIHVDSNNRIMGFLFYLSDLDEMGGEGGELGLYTRDSSEKTFLSKSIKPVENSSVWKLDAHDCWHNVKQMKNTNGWRKFVYVAITSKKVGVWKHKNTQWPNQEQYEVFKTLKF